MPRQSLPALDLLSQRLAHNNRRIRLALDEWPALTKQLVAAWHRGDRRALRALAGQLLLAAPRQSPLVAIARDLDQHLAQDDARGTQRALLALVGEVGALRGISATATAP